MTNELEKAANVVAVDDAVLDVARNTGKLPQHWWTSDGCWRMLAKLAGQFANSTMVPQSYRNEPGNVIVAMAAGMPLGLSPLACLQSVAVINGRPTLWGDAVLAQVLAHDSLLNIEETATGSVDDGDRQWTISITRQLRSKRQQVIARTFSIGDAKRAGLWDKAGPWKTYPDRMIYNRARAYAVRDSFADVLAGIAIAADMTEDVRHIEATVVDATPAPSHTLTANVESLAVKPEVDAQAEPKPKRKRRTAKEIAAEVDASLPDMPPKPAFELVSLQVAEWGDTMSHLDAGTVFVDFEHMDIHYCNGSGWQLIHDDKDQVAACKDFVEAALRKKVAQGYMNKRISGADAMVHAQEALGLPETPKGLQSFDMTQLAELVNDLR